MKSLFTPSLYTGRLFAQALLQICLLAIFVEALYLSERSISILRMIIDEPVGVTNFLPLLGWTAPEVYLALPIAVLIAVYRTILRGREQREFVALASSGQSMFPLISSTATIALLASLFSLVISGLVFPYAKFAFRHDSEEIRYEALRGGGSPGQFLYLPNYAIYLFPSLKQQPKRPIFIKQIVSASKYRIVNADQTNLVEGRQPGSMTIQMFGVTVHTLPNLNEPWIDSEPDSKIYAQDLPCDRCDDNVTSLQTSSLMRQLDISSLIRFEPRGATLDEWMMPELLGLIAPPSGLGPKPGAQAEALRRFSRGLLSFLAPLLAWLTLSFTARRSLAFALPLACALLMSADIASSQLIAALGPNNSGLALTVIVFVTCACAVTLIWQTIVRQHLIVTPSLARS
jgi:lipopolysaccharide export system permease protein